MSDGIKNKADNFSNKINELNKKFDQAEEVCSGEVVEFITQKQKDIELFVEKAPENSEIVITKKEVMKLNIMIDDFKMTRESLTDTITNGRKILNSIALDILDSDEDAKASLITSYAELTKGINDSVKVFSGLYKQISETLINLENLEAGTTGKSDVTNIENVTVNTVNTVDLIQQLENAKKGKE